MNEARETIIIEDEFEDDDTKELDISQFDQNRGNMSCCQVTTFPSTNRSLTVS